MKKSKNKKMQKLKVSIALDLCHHMQLGDDWTFIIDVLSEFGTDNQIDKYITHFKNSNKKDFEDSTMYIIDFKGWLRESLNESKMPTQDQTEEIDIENAEKLLEIMGYNWKNHYDSYSHFIENLGETINYNFK